jgi:poly(3-hydroxybutyrate) depolymerase
MPEIEMKRNVSARIPKPPAKLEANFSILLVNFHFLKAPWSHGHQLGLHAFAETPIPQYIAIKHSKTLEEDMMKFTTFATGALALSLAGCATQQVATKAESGTLAQCDSLKAAFTFANTEIDSAAPVAAGPIAPGGPAAGAHCLVKGKMHKRKTADNKDYAIGFEMRLPNAWNGRFYYQGNGGLDGTVQPAQGATGGGPITGALAQGFAVLSADAGHTGAQTTQFGFDPQARLDYGYQAVGKLTPMGKALAKAAYGKAPGRSYIGGCSNGGRHAMVAAARYADMFDGYLVGAPGFNLPKAALANLWNAQEWAPLHTPGSTTEYQGRTFPDVGTALVGSERRLIAAAIINKCDALDGATDGIVNAVAQCQSTFNIDADVPSCADNKRTLQCLTPAQKATFKRTMGGHPEYARFWVDPGLAAPNWAQWKFVNSLALDPLAIGTLFRPMPAMLPNALAHNIDYGYIQINQKAANGETAMGYMTPPEPLKIAAKLNARGGKMMIYHGVSDGIFSAADTAKWLTDMKAADAQTDNAAQLYLVPGMNHCSAGPATDQFDMLTPLVKWVEEGIVPTSVTASARGAGNAGGVNADVPATWSATRTRPLCAFPKIATYVSGDVEVAASFVCR